MNNKWIGIMLILVALLLSGCSMQSVDELYRLPKRSEEFTNLQTVISSVMTGLEYSAPIAGENRQTVQAVDLDGDGKSEHILFAKGSAEKPLQIFIFSGGGGKFSLLDSIEFSGTAFDQVEYVQLNEAAGFELVVGRQVSNEVLRSVSVYTLVDGQMEMMLTTNYAKYLCSDMEEDGCSELFVLRPGATDSDGGIAELYSFQGGTANRYAQLTMSAPVDKIKRIISGRLQDGKNAVFVASSLDQTAVTTDVFAMVNGEFTNVALSNDTGTTMETYRDHYVFGDDIDNDGILELPTLIPMKISGEEAAVKKQYLISWYAMMSDGTKVEKMHTYHNFEGGWYLILDSEIGERFTVIQRGNGYYFYLWDEYMITVRDLMSIHVLTGQKREEQAVEGNRFVIHRSESAVYAAKLEVLAASHGMTKENVKAAFRIIQQDWKTGET